MWDVSGGIAAAYVKHIKAGDIVAPLLFAHELWRAVRNLLARTVTLQRPFGFRRLAGFVAGTVIAARTASDRRSGLYRRPEAGPAREEPLRGSAAHTGAG